MSAILQTAYTSPNGCSSVPVGSSERARSRGISERGMENCTSQTPQAGQLQGLPSAAPDLDGMTTHAASSVADTSEFPLDFSEDPANQLFAAESDPDDDSEHETSEILHHTTALLSRSGARERNVGMSPLFVDTSSATSSPTRSIRPRSPNGVQDTQPSRLNPTHISSDRDASLGIRQNSER